MISFTNTVPTLEPALFRSAEPVECSPNPDPCVMRVQRPELGERTFDERQETLSEQIIKKLREAEAMIATGKTIGQVVQALEISEQTFHRWRNQFGGMKAEEAKRLKELEIENKRLKKLLAEAQLDKEILKEALEGNY